MTDVHSFTNGALANGGGALPLPAIVPAEAAEAADAEAALMAEARVLVETTTRSQAEIAIQLGISANTLSAWKRADGWVRPAGAPKAPKFATGIDRRRSGATEAKAETRRRRLIDRLYLVCGRQVRRIEARLKVRGREVEEKDVKTLGTLARTLDMLMALERDNGTKAERPESVDRDQRNAELARRIRRWAQGGEGSE